MQTEAQPQISLRPIGSPLPLGFFSFGIGSILTGALQLQWIPQDQTHLVALIGLSFVAPLEFLAGVFAFLARDGAAGTTLSLFAGSWAALGISQLTGPPGAASKTMAILFLALAAILVALATVAMKTKPLFGMLLIIAIARFVSEAIHNLVGSTVSVQVAGWIGVGVAAVALYGGLALLLEDTRLETVLPTGRREQAQRALDQGFKAQGARLEREAGVRDQL